MNKHLDISSIVKILLPLFILSANYVAFAEQQKIELTNDGVAALNDGNYAEAEDYFLIKLKETEQKNESLIYLSQIALETGDSERAVKYIEQALSIGPTSSDELLISGDIYCAHAQRTSIFGALKLARKCIAQYEAAVNKDPESVSALVSSIKFYLSAPAIAGGSAKKGNALLEHLSTLSPEYADTYKIQMLEKQDGEQSALALADELSKNGFKFAENQYQVARYYKEKKHYQKSKDLFEPLLASNKTQKNKWFINDSFLQMGEIYLTEGKDINQGVALIETYKKNNSNPYDSHYFWSTWSLAKGYKALGDVDKYDVLVKSIKSEDYKRDGAFAKEFESSI